jgi:nucleoside-diphosphate-sugar epimerase
MLDMLLSMNDASNEVRIDTARLQLCDATKFCNLTGWRLQIPREKILKDPLDYWRERV